jgi:hypothetical protein
MIPEHRPPAHRTVSTRSVKSELPMNDASWIGPAYGFTGT